jgi:predicted ArsR family transcriptional regulator
MGRSVPIREFQDSTRGRLLALLLDGHATVAELATELDLTDNAVRAQLIRLRNEGYVRLEGKRRSGGRPAHVYGLAPRAQEAFPDGGPAVLVQLMATLQDRMDPAEVDRVLADTGRRIARRLREDGSDPAFPGVGDAPESTDGANGDAAPLGPEEALELLRALGGQPRAERRNGVLEITSPTCVLGPAGRANEKGCEIGRALLEELLRAPVERRGSHENGWPRCGFEVALSDIEA